MTRGRCGVAPPPAAKGASETCPSRADGGASGGEIEPIDLAIAPDGGVPYHPEGRASVAVREAAPGPTVRVNVGMLLNSVDDYDIKSRHIRGGLFLSLTSELPCLRSTSDPNGRSKAKR